MICKAEGGIGMDNLHHTSLVLKLRWSGRIINEEDVVWVQLAKASIAHSLDKGFGRRTRRLWTITKAILLDDQLHIYSSPLLHDILKGFNLARKSLLFEKRGAVLPMHLTLEHILLLFRSKDFLSPPQERSVLGILKFQGVAVLGDLWNCNLGCRSTVSFCHSTRSTHQDDDAGLVWFLGFISLLAPLVVVLKIQDSNGWSWQMRKKLVKSWSLPNHTWNDLLTSLCTVFTKLNLRWNVNFPIFE